MLTVVRRRGTRADGGAYESEYLQIFVRSGRHLTRFEIFELDDLDAALARFEELRPDPLRIPGNAASRAQDRWSEVCARRDWDALRALYADDVMLDDRRPLTRNTTSGLDTLVANARYLWETSGGRVQSTRLAVAGDRLALELHRWCARAGVPEFEVDRLELTEVDEQGRFRRITLFDAADRAAASTEMAERSFRLEPKDESVGAMETMRAWNAHDPARLLEVLPPEFYIDDRRRTGVGVIRGAKAWVDSLVAIWDLSADIHVESLFTIAEGPSALLFVCRWAGRYAEGSEFAAVYLAIALRRDGLLAGLELFEPEDAEIAHARFECLAR